MEPRHISTGAMGAHELGLYLVEIERRVADVAVPALVQQPVDARDDFLRLRGRHLFEDARRGFIGSLPKVEFRNADGRVIYSLEDYAFLADEQAPDTVNPSLWRQARLT